MNKATISLWFRVPGSSVSACKSDTFPNWGIPVFLGVIPLITWGQQASGTAVISPPSYIGVLVNPDIVDSLPGPTLDVNLQTPNFGGGDPSVFDTTSPVNFGNSNHYSGPSGGLPGVTIDAWNHVLISWDLHSDTSNAANSLMYCAINNKNQAGSDLPALNNPDIMGANQHVSHASWLGASLELSTISSKPVVIPAPSSVRYNTNPDGGQGNRNPIYKVELAELQIFCGVMLDTSSATNRHAFVDAKGKPVPANQKANPETGKESGSIELLGRKPDVMLHGVNDWKHGRNSGSVGIDEDGHIIDDGQFDPSGKIKEYKPDPKLGG